MPPRAAFGDILHKKFNHSEGARVSKFEDTNIGRFAEISPQHGCMPR